jgi:hypothetical protein
MQCEELHSVDVEISVRSFVIKEREIETTDEAKQEAWRGIFHLGQFLGHLKSEHQTLS